MLISNANINSLFHLIEFDSTVYYNWIQDSNNSIFSVLSSGNATVHELTDDDIIHCGSNYCPNTEDTSEEKDDGAEKKQDNFETDITKIYIIAGIFLGCSLAAAAIVAIFVDPLTRFGEDERNDDREQLSGVQLLVATFRHMKNKNQILVIPITIWSGIEQGYFNADFTAVCHLIL